jgi:hypothetical protein
MASSNQLHTITEVAAKLFKGENPCITIGEFLCDWRHNPDEIRQGLIKESLPQASTYDEQRWAAFCAAIVEELCVRASLASPDWTQEPSYFLPDPWYYRFEKSQRCWLISKDLEPFVHRNIYVENCTIDTVFDEMEHYQHMDFRPRWCMLTEEELQKFREILPWIK